MAKIDDYTLERELGQGGFGTVYEVRDPEGRRLALKILHRSLVSDPTVVQRFFQEALILARLQHAAIPKVYHFGPFEGTYYLVQEFVEGREIAAVIGDTPLSVPEAVGVMDQLLDALAYAHQHEIIHRDLKPANLVLEPSGRLRILDFGIAKIIGGAQLTAPGIVNVTLGYAAPEQLRGSPLDARADIFAAGILFHQLLTCKLPHPPTSKDALKAYQAQLAWTRGPRASLQALDPSIPDWADAFYKRCTAADPNDRFPDARAARDSLLKKETPEPLKPRIRPGAGGPTRGQIEAASSTDSLDPRAALARAAVTVTLTSDDPEHGATTKWVVPEAPPALTAGSAAADAPTVRARIPAGSARASRLPLILLALGLSLIALTAVALLAVFLGLSAKAPSPPPDNADAAAVEVDGGGR